MRTGSPCVANTFRIERWLSAHDVDARVDMDDARSLPVLYVLQTLEGPPLA